MALKPTAAAVPPLQRTPTLNAAAVGRPMAPRRFLFAMSELGRPTANLERAIALAHAHDAEVHVLRVLPRLAKRSSVRPPGALLETIRAIDRTLAALRHTEAWLRDFKEFANATGHLEIREGHFVEQVAERAAELGAELIILPPREGRTGSAVTTLARASRTPVLVIRGPMPNRTILAATDLASNSYPVLRMAAAFGNCLSAPMVAMHNVPSLPTVSSPDVPWPVAVHPRDVMTLRIMQLIRATNLLAVSAVPHMANEPDTVEAILYQMRSRDTDLLVIGTRPHSWLDRLMGCGVSSQLVSRAQRSVLVAPIDASG